MSRTFFGINAQLVAPLAAAGQTAEANTQISGMAALGVDFARANLDWRALEPAPPGPSGPMFDFTPSDRWVAALAEHGMRWQITGIGLPNPAWAGAPAPPGCHDHGPPDPAAYAGMMGAIAKRYGAGGDFWAQNPALPYEPVTQFEIWNEPNSGYSWCPQPDPAAYAALYAASREAIHRVDPSATVLFAGLASFRTTQASGGVVQMSVPDFIDGVLGARPDLAGNIDAIGVHPYAATPDDVLATLRWLRATFDSHDLADVPLSVNEIGWVTSGSGGPPPISEAVRASYLRTITADAPFPGCQVVGLAAHAWTTAERNPGSAEDWWGIANPVTAASYPSATAFGSEVHALESSGSSAPNACGS